MPSLDLGAPDVFKVTSYVPDISFTFLIIPNPRPKFTRLFKVDYKPSIHKNQIK